LRLDRGTLSVGAIADVSIFDLAQEWVVDEKKFFSKGKNSPFIGKKLAGKATCTIVGGEVKFKDGNIIR
jgi:dihydroorotase